MWFVGDGKLVVAAVIMVYLVLPESNYKVTYYYRYLPPVPATKDPVSTSTAELVTFSAVIIFFS